MRPLLLLAVLMTCPPALFAGETPPAADSGQPARPELRQADWRQGGIDDRVKAALTGQGWRFEEDGRALEPKTKAPATVVVFNIAVRDLSQGARRAALETVNLILSTGKPLEEEDKRTIRALADDLPPRLAAAILDPNADMPKVKAMADAGLSRVAAYFDGGRTLADREAASRPVTAGTPGPRVDLPYFTAQEKTVGDLLRSSAAAEIGRDPFGKTVLSRLKTNRKPDLPPIVIEEQSGGVVAQYDFRRRAVVLDREGVLASVVGTVPPRQAAGLRASLSDRAALLSYLEAHPEAIAAVVKDNDVVLVHELTHAWQDRRDPIFREITRGNLPDTQPLEYEEEAYKTKNMYLRSKLEHDPASVKMDSEFTDFISMLHGVDSWRDSLFSGLRNSSPSRALPLASIRSVQDARAQTARRKQAVSSDDQKAKALDLLGLTRAQKELADLDAAHLARMAPLDAEIRRAGSDRAALLGPYYLAQALRAERDTDRFVLLEQAERYAVSSQNATLLAEIRKAKEKK